MHYKKLCITDQLVEVEYQADTIGRYDLDFDGKDFLLVTKQTACLASDACGIAPVKQKIEIHQLQGADKNSCSPGIGCC